jgi:predicted nucleotidyltransferase
MQESRSAIFKSWLPYQKGRANRRKTLRFSKTYFGYSITQNGFYKDVSNMSEVTQAGCTGLADALFSATRQKVLRLFFTRKDSDFSIKELIEEAKAGSGAVQREVVRLVDSGLVQVNLQGRQKRYRANPDSPVYPELISLVTKLLGPEQQVEDALRPIFHKIDLALIYGSVAKRNDHADSDIDLMLVSDTLTLEEVFEVLGPAESNLSRTINPTLYNRNEFKKRRANESPFLKKVLEGQYILLKGSINESGSIGEPGPDTQAPP